MEDKLESKKRVASLERETGETNIKVEVCLDGSGKAELDTPLGFLNHMLNQFARHGMLDLKLKARGDIETGTHHTIEDIAILMGRSIDAALGERRGIVRMADAICPLDEALAQVVLDMSGRGYAVVNMSLEGNIGEFPPDMVRHFFETLAIEGRFCLHVRVLAGTNEHHVIEATFKAFSRAFRAAVTIDPLLVGVVPSTKGRLR